MFIVMIEEGLTIKKYIFNTDKFHQAGTLCKSHVNKIMNNK